jgi:uncharacterized protein DUF4382/uncharacterized protein DUF5666
MNSFPRALPACVSAILAASLAACGGGGSSGSVSPIAPQTATMPVLISDASSEDWATIGVKVLAITITPQGGGDAVTIFTSANGQMVNLEQLDQISEIIGNATVPVGTYTGATLTVAANPGDVVLTTSAAPEAGFAAAASTTIPSSQIQIQDASGASGSKTVAIKLTFDSPLVVSSGSSNALDLEFDLGHPAFIVGHVPPAVGTTLWAVDFDGPVRCHHIGDLQHLVLRHTYGTVVSVSSDNTSIKITKDYPAIPVQSPETAVAGTLSLSILADATNGTLFYDADAKTVTTIKDFSAEASSLPTKYVRVAARYQENGTLVATRIWASSSFDRVWLSPEGHVLKVDPTNDLLIVQNESGEPVTLSVDASTEFFFRTPASAIADATPIGTGPAFLANNNMVRGFKVHVSVVDPLATPLVAQTVDIETAAFNGRISNSTTSSFSYTRDFIAAADDYTVTLGYISPTSANGDDSNGNPIVGFKYWNFAYPTLLISGPSAVAEFVAATNDGVNFGGTYGSVAAWGASFARWGDSANPSGWSIPWTVLEPTPLPRGSVASALVSGTSTSTFTMNVPGGTMAATIDVSTGAGSATLVYQVDRTNGVVTVSPEDVTTAAGLAALTAGLAVGAPVKVYGVPQSDGTLKAYVLTYFTGEMPTI